MHDNGSIEQPSFGLAAEALGDAELAALIAEKQREIEALVAERDNLTQIQADRARAWRLTGSIEDSKS